jgi:hypothetical protein
MSNWQKEEKKYLEEPGWVKVTYIQTPDVGDTIAYCDGFRWNEVTYNDKMHEDGWWMTGVHNETCRLYSPMFGSIYFKRKEKSKEKVVIRPLSDPVSYNLEQAQELLKWSNISLILSIIALIIALLAFFL